MKKKLFLITFVITIICYTNCKKIFHRTVKCRAFNLTEEHYWNPLKNGDTVVFVNATGVKKRFTVIDKQIAHRKKYISDTGCGCLDETSMLMINNNDSIWFKNEIRYIEKQTGKNYEDVVFVLNNKKSIFYETHMTLLSSYSIDSTVFSNIKKFTYNYTDNQNVKTVYLVKNLGIIIFETVDGEVWINKNLTNYAVTTIESFFYSENTCI